VYPLVFLALGPLFGVLGLFVYAFVSTLGRASLEDFTIIVDLVPSAYIVGCVPAFLTGIFYSVLVTLGPRVVRRQWLLRGAIAGLIGASTTMVLLETPAFALAAGFPAALLCSTLVSSQDRLKFA
jgi:hypothetical protein